MRLRCGGIGAELKMSKDNEMGIPQPNETENYKNYTFGVLGMGSRPTPNQHHTPETLSPIISNAVQG